MSSTHTIRPKIKTGNPSSIHHPKKSHHQKFLTPTSPHKLYQIHTQFIKTTLSEFDTEFDQTLAYQHKINFLTI